jgi:hypothetical protein
MTTQRNFEDTTGNDAWRRIVEKKGSPVPKDLADQTREQLEKYAENCQKFMLYSQEQANDPQRNNDGYWTAATLWWEMRIEAINNRAKRAPTVPLPRFREGSLDNNRFQPYGAPRSLPTPTRTAIQTMPTPKATPLATSYGGDAWNTSPAVPPTYTPSTLPASPTYQQLMTGRELVNPELLDDATEVRQSLWDQLVTKEKASLFKLTKEDKAVIYGNVTAKKVPTPPPSPTPSPSDCTFTINL